MAEVQVLNPRIARRLTPTAELHISGTGFFLSYPTSTCAMATATVLDAQIESFVAKLSYKKSLSNLSADHPLHVAHFQLARMLSQDDR